MPSSRRVSTQWTHCCILECMRSNLTTAMLALLVMSCTAGVASPNAPAATAHLALRSLSPLAGSHVDEQTELVAEIEYRIDGFKSGVDYYVTPLFASAKAADTTFSMLDHISDAARVSAPEGRITVRYPIRRELRSTELARPLTIWFYLMERTGARQTRVIGKTEPIAFKTTAD
jgi:hypothetical protein